MLGVVEILTFLYFYLLFLYCIERLQGQFFNTCVLYINTTKNLQGQYCAVYSETWSSKYATNAGQYRGNDYFLFEYSYAYSNLANAGVPSVNAAAHQASVDISYATLQPFCTSYLATPSVTIASTPAVLTKYPATVLSSACSMQITPAPTPA
ncbi:Uu.00g011850.m01.CDS01 [Anthostomella pinea]|uniref:Uu.00g011850.m01.CDS01 n=1 Tax=Anthostomella pinea TaxID=933095 RepID=A0AAI8VXU3_9PEZI|nr:Uu.00g011850.m01.CDS01 [Anthostomella pinea]